MAVVLGTGGLSLAASVAWVLHHQRRVEPPRGAPAAPTLVLGCRPGPALVRRVATAADLHARGLTDRVIVSGRGEADVGVALARQMGVPQAHLREEPDARTTHENLVLARPLLGEGPFWLVSHRYHLPRALGMARRLGMRALPCPVEPQMSPLTYGKQLGREGVSLIFARLSGQL